MSKAYKVDRTNGDVALENDSVVTVYDSLDDAQLNIDNIEEGQIIGTKDDLGTDAIEDTIKADLDEYAENLMQSYGQAVGSYLTMEDNSVTPQGYLLADGRDTTGTEDELVTKYPLLYAYLGNSNVLPLEYGLRYNPIEYISTELADKTAADPYIVPYDGTIYVVVSSVNGYGRVGANLNGNWINFTRGWGSATGVNAGFTINVKKGDTLYFSGATTGSITTPDASTGLPNDNKWYASAVWKKPVYKYIKAVSGIETSSTEATEVANAITVAETTLSTLVFGDKTTLAEAANTYTQAVVVNTRFVDSLLNYEEIWFYARRSGSVTAEFVPIMKFTHEQIVDCLATSKEIVVSSDVVHYAMTFDTAGEVCTAVNGNVCVYKVIGYRKRS